MSAAFSMPPSDAREVGPLGPWRLVRVGGPWLMPAVARLLGVETGGGGGGVGGDGGVGAGGGGRGVDAPGSGAAIAREFIEQAQRDRMDLSLMVAAVHEEAWGRAARGAWGASESATIAEAPASGPVPASRLVGQVCLATPSPGRTVALFVSASPSTFARGRTDAQLDHRLRAAVISAALRVGGAGPAGPARMAQTLLDPDQTDVAEGFARAGFWRLADLGYLRRTLAPRDALWGAGRSGREHRGGGAGAATAAGRGAERESGGELILGPGLRLVPLDRLPPARGDAWLREALTRSYEQTLDCPGLCGLRDLDDVIASHRAIGRYDPSLWFLLVRDEAAGSGGGVGARAGAGVGAGAESEAAGGVPGGEPVGCMLLSSCPPQDTVELVYLGLCPSVRGRGLGAAMLKHAVSVLTSPGRSETTLACAVDLANAPALALYRGAKFQRFATKVAWVRALS